MSFLTTAIRRTCKLWALLASTPRQLLLVDSIRFIITFVRYVWFVMILRRIKVYNTTTEAVAPNTVMHNIKGMRDVGVNRSHLILRPLVSIDQVRSQIRNKKILTIGARSEGEFYNLLGYGFSRANITILDLISYSPYFDLGDMHHMPYADSTFDISVSSWVIAYSDNKRLAAAEMIRVTKPNGFIAISCESHPLTNDEIKAQAGYLPGSEERLYRLDQILKDFEGSIDHIYFSHPESKIVPDQGYSQMIAIFSIKK